MSLLEVGVPRNDVFDPAIWDLINRFQGNPFKNFSTTYTIGERDCKDSVIVTLVVVPDAQGEPLCNLTAGVDNSVLMSVSNAAAIENWDEIRKLYLTLLEPEVPKDGGFDPTTWDLIENFNETGDHLGDYTTTYTITNAECTDSVN